MLCRGGKGMTAKLPSTFWILGPSVLCLAFATCAKAEEEFNCQHLDQVPQEQRCQFVTTECDSGARLPFMELYYCKVEPAGAIAKFLYMILLACVLPLLFTLLGDTAEMYFSPTMAVVSQSIPKMRPRFAGVTFVAMGNGAPDLSANISAIRNGSVQLSAGAFTGAAMFVQCVVASEVIRISNGAPCRGATLRDVATFSVSVIGVALAFSSGTITRWFVVGALIVYALYAVWVFCGDEWHAQGRPKPHISWSQVLQLLRQSRNVADPLPQWAPLEETEPLVPDQHRAPPAPHHHRPAQLLDAETYRQAVWADLSSDRSMLSAIRTARSLEHDVREMEMGVSETYSPPSPADTLKISEADDPEHAGRLSGLHRPAGDSPLPVLTPTQAALFVQDRTSDGAPGRWDDGSLHSDGFGSQGSFFRAHAAHVLSREDAAGPGAVEADSVWQKICNELTVGSAAEWPELTGFRKHLRRVTFPILLPIYAALRLTIPFIDPAGYSQQWLVVTMLCAPLATTLYFDVTHLWAVILAIVVGVVLAAAVHVLTYEEEELPALDLGTSFAFGPAVFSLMGFFMGVLWIDTLASEVVGILSLVANVVSMPSSLVGLTLLAWGSSLGDFYGNAALAKRGHATTALTACFAGPLFNMLVSLALGFSSNFAAHGTSSIHVALTPDVILGCVCLVLYNLIVAIVGISNGFKLPERFYLFARVWYFLYVVTACTMGIVQVSQS